VEAVDQERIFGHAQRQQHIVGARQFHGDQAADQGNEVDRFKQQVDAPLGDVRQLDVEPAALSGAGDLAKNGVLRTAEQGLENGIVLVQLFFQFYTLAARSAT